MNWRLPTTLTLCLGLLTGCGGGGAGDVINGSGENTAGPLLVEQFVGVWQLRSGWSSSDPDEALLVIRAPGDDNRSAVLLYDFTDEADVASQCYREPFGNGEAFDSLTDEVFLDFGVFPDGIVSSVSENSISIEFTDADDINGNSNREERLSTSLSRVAQVESDIAPICN